MTAPALLVAVPLLLGVLMGAIAAPRAAATVPALVLCVTACGIATFAAPRRNGLARLCRVSAAGLAAIGSALAGAAFAAAAQRGADHPPLLAWYAAARPDRPAHLIGTLRYDAATTGSGVSMTVDVVTADARPTAGGVRLSVGGRLAAVAASEWRGGRLIEVDAQLREPLDYRDPGVASDRARLARQGVALLGSVKSAAQVSVRARGPFV